MRIAFWGAERIRDELLTLGIRRLERELALAKREETALVIDWQPQWDVGAPLPHVLSPTHHDLLSSTRATTLAARRFP